MHWVVVAPFNVADEERGWLTPSVRGTAHVPVGRRHSIGAAAGGSNLDPLGGGTRAVRRRHCGGGGGGVITVFRSSR